MQRYNYNPNEIILQIKMTNSTFSVLKVQKWDQKAIYFYVFYSLIK